MKDQAVEVALVTVEDPLEREQRLIAAERLKAERKKLRLARRLDTVKSMIAGIKLGAAKRVRLQGFVFLSDEELTERGLTAQQIRIVRQWEEPKRNAAYACESSSKLIEAETRAQAQNKETTINVDTLIVKLPPKGGAQLPEPIVVKAEDVSK